VPPNHAGQLHHLEIYVSDLARSCEFWGWLLGELGYAAFFEDPDRIKVELVAPD